MNHGEVWLEQIEWVEDGNALDELFNVLRVVPYDANQAASVRDGAIDSPVLT